MGKPIIAYSIQTALDSGLFDNVMVSTDDAEIAEVAKQYGASVPFMRSASNSNDTATTTAVLFEVLDEHEKLGQRFDYACSFYPCAPLVTTELLKQAYNTLTGQNADSSFPIIKYSMPPQRGLMMRDGRSQMVYPEYIDSSSQSLEPMYYDAGAFHFFNAQRFMKTKKIYSDNAMPFVIDEMQAQDIDNQSDWQLAEIKYKLLKQ